MAPDPFPSYHRLICVDDTVTLALVQVDSAWPTLLIHRGLDGGELQEGDWVFSTLGQCELARHYHLAS